MLAKCHYFKFLISIIIGSFHSPGSDQAYKMQLTQKENFEIKLFIYLYTKFCNIVFVIISSLFK